LDIEHARFLADRAEVSRSGGEPGAATETEDAAVKTERPS